MQFKDEILTCVACGADFLFTIEEQRELVSRGVAPRRRRCSLCRTGDETELGYEGRVKWFDERKGFGFIEWNEGEDVFVHYSAISGEGFRTLAEGERVCFQLEESDRGLQAVKVSRLSDIPSTFSFYSATRLSHP